MSGDLERVGLEFVAVDKDVSKFLRATDKLLLQVHRHVGDLGTAFAGVGRGMASTFGRQASALSRISGSLQGISRFHAQNAKTAREQVKIDGLRQANEEKLRGLAQKTAQERAKAQEAEQRADERLRQERMRTLQMEQGGIRRATTEEEQRQRQRVRDERQIAEITVRTDLQRRRGLESDDRRLILAQRLRREEMRTEQLEQRITRQKHQQTEDQKLILDFQERIKSAMSTGNRIQTGMTIARGGLGVTRGVLGLGNTTAMHEYLIQKQGLVNMGLGKQQTQVAMAAGRSLGNKVQGLNRADTLDLMKDAILTFGVGKKGAISAEALNPAILQEMAKFSVAAGTTFGLGQGQVYQAVKVAELLTRNTKGMSPEARAASFSNAMNLEYQAMAGLGGKVRPSELYQFMRRAGAAKYGLSQEGMRHLLPVIQENGGSQVGRQVMSLEQNLANGVGLNARSATNLLHMGLLDAAKVHITKAGLVSRVNPGALKGDQLLRQDPFAWYEKYLAPRLAGDNIRQAQQTVASILSNRTAMNLAMTYFTQDARIHKDTRLERKSMGVDASFKSLQGTYQIAQRNFETSLQRLQVDLGVAILPALTRGMNALSGVIEGVDRVISAHPLAAKIGVIGTAIAGVAATIAGAAIAIKGAWTAMKVMGGLNAILGGGAPGAAGGSGVAGLLTSGAEQAAGSAAVGGVEEMAAGAAGRGLLGRIFGALGGDALAAAVPRSPIAAFFSKIGSLGVGFARQIGPRIGSSLVGAITKFGDFAGVQALGEMFSGLLAGIVTYGPVVAAGLALGAGIGMLIRKGIGDAKIQDFMAGIITAIGGQASQKLQQQQAAATKAKTGLTPAQLHSLSVLNAKRIDHHLAPLSPQAYEKMTAQARDIVGRSTSSPRTGPGRGVPTHHSITVPVTLTVNGHVPHDQAHAIAKEAGARGGRMIQDHVEDLLKTNRPTRSTPWQDR